jgi:type I restriction enzyme ecoAI specificity protein
MIDTKVLREKILDLAIRGKLVPQDPNDEPATVLLERIREQKKQMVKDSKLKAKDIKNDTAIFKGDDNLHYEKFSDGTVKCIEDEIPFDVPEGWTWARLNDLALYKKGPFGSSITKAMFVPESDNAIKVYEQKNAINKNAHLGHYFISQEKYQELKGFEIFPGDIIVSCAGTIGKTFVMPSDMHKGIINQALMKIHLYDNSIKDFYLMYFDNKLKSLANEQGYGMALKNIPPFSVLKQYLMPIPPMAEQEKILERIKIILSNINDIDLLKGKLQSNIANAKSKILDLAIRGELVPQDPNDEPASILLDRIRAEKEELIKAGKIKRDKKESVIFKGDDNSYYQKIETGEAVYTEKLSLPPNWVACTIMDISYTVGNKDNQILTKSLNCEGRIPVISQGQKFIDGYCDDIEKGIYDVPVLLFGDHTKVVKYIDVPFVVGADGTKLHKIIQANNKFVYYWMLYAAINLDDKGYARHYSLLKRTALWFPPLAEQKRIVEAIETIFAQLDEITNSIA